MNTTAKQLAESVAIPKWAKNSFSLPQLAVLAVIRDSAYKAADGTCRFTVKEIARRAGVSTDTASKALVVALAVGVVERIRNGIVNRHIHYQL